MVKFRKEALQKQKTKKCTKTKQKKISDYVATSLKEKKSIKEISKEVPGFVMMGLKKVQFYESWLKQKPIVKKEFKGFTPPKNEAEKQIVTWFKENVGLTKRPWQNQHLFIYGKTQMGKTTFIENLEDYFNIYELPMDEDFYDLYTDEFDIIVLDQFKSQKNIQFLCQFLDGEITLRRKGSQYLKRKPLPCIILSNYELKECYKNVYDKNKGIFEKINRRLKKVLVSEFISLVPNPQEKN